MTMFDYMGAHSQWLCACQASRYSYSAKWDQKLKNQSRVSSYNTTKWAQCQTIGVLRELNPHTEALREAIEKVISDSRTQVGKLYKRKSRRIRSYEHRQTPAIRKVFKVARAPVIEASKKLDRLKGEKTRASAAVTQAARQVEQLENSPTSDKSKLKQARGKLVKKQEAFQNIETKIVQANEELQDQQAVYRKEATKIFEQYQKYEKQRLNLIRKILIKFVQAMHSANYSKNIDRVYKNLLDKIENEQNTDKDLSFWKTSFGVDDACEADYDEEEDDDENEEAVYRSKTETPAEEPATATPSVRSNKDAGKKKQSRTSQEMATPSSLNEEPATATPSVRSNKDAGKKKQSRTSQEMATPSSLNEEPATATPSVRSSKDPDNEKQNRTSQETTIPSRLDEELAKTITSVPSSKDPGNKKQNEISQEITTPSSLTEESV